MEAMLATRDEVNPEVVSTTVTSTFGDVNRRGKPVCCGARVCQEAVEYATRQGIRTGLTRALMKAKTMKKTVDARLVKYVREQLAFVTVK